MKTCSSCHFYTVEAFGDEFGKCHAQPRPNPMLLPVYGNFPPLLMGGAPFALVDEDALCNCGRYMENAF